MNGMQVRENIRVFLSFFLAWVLMLLPMPYDWYWMRPQWLILILIYWIFALPHSIGIVTAWLAGFVMDLLSGELLGQYALSMVIVAVLARSVRYRMRLFSVWQQALVVLGLVLISDMVLLLVQWFIGRPPQTLLYWVSAVSSVLLWPCLHRLLHLYERKAFI